ncbi:hypothetical protein BU24DRAFT_399265 [Aaosphaeria arxii CBS 175.79]|uniref:U3 small nucleolar RNA-associated protein 10 n=1 Tax=Aaosphaeria arxii CBS 175.79 TaxID=1450172 RepID=A0A6A5XDX1_9PLEO|nr:uncharacterized protein BU24DRAFT_399265 [Aaosphaeria arxii CBS 175.79]KAF2011080.1 hypothetical protein BU24DRAFT_399265 [Aaosphaeria arxii CBS 175.79]
MSSLQQQLAAIAATSTHQLDLKAQKTAHGKSLLFESRVAASQSFDLIFSICYEGFRDLCALDQRFLSFARTLFSEQSKSEDRTQMTKKENDELDRVLESFITLVGSRILLKPAEKALEWLVRRFRVHEYNTETLVLSYLPYHSTPQFLALLSILPSTPPPTLRFLQPYLAPPTNPPREAIVYTAVNTPALFAALQSYVVKSLQAKHHGASLLSFWASVTAQALDAILDASRSGRREIQDQRTEQVLLRILPALNECLKLSDIPDANLGCYMILIILVTKASFEDKVLDSLLEAVIRSYGLETADGCLTCLAIIAEERSSITLPIPVEKRLFRIPDLPQALEVLATKCRAERLALGSALASLDRLSHGKHPEESREIFQRILESSILGPSYKSAAVSSFFRVFEESTPGSEAHGQLLELLSQLSESMHLAPLLQTIAQANGIDMDAMGVTVQVSLQVEDQGNENSDEEMLDVGETSQQEEQPSITLPKIDDSTFFCENVSSFSGALATFERAVVSKQAAQLLASKELETQNGHSKPLFLSFLVRTWSTSSSVPTRIEAIVSTTKFIKKTETAIDLQILIPYLLLALSDPAPAVRRAAATCIATLTEKSMGNGAKTEIWASSTFYGQKSSSISHLKSGECAQLLSSLFVPMLEECVMDSTSAIRLVRESLEGSKSIKTQAGPSLKSSVRGSALTFFASHIAVTPLLQARLRLLPIFNFTGKHAIGVRTTHIIPTIRTWCSLSNEEASSRCAAANINLSTANAVHLGGIVAREHESVKILQDLISGDLRTDNLDVVSAAFDRLIAVWTSIKSETRLSIGQILLDLALQEKHISESEKLRCNRSLEALRVLRLDTAILSDFIESIPNALQMPEGPPTKKRRRSSRNEMVRAEIQSPEDVSKLLRRTTIVLELIEASSPGDHPVLLKNLFGILGDLQQLRHQSGSDLVYLQSLVLGSLTPIVDRLKDDRNAAEYQASVRADLLVDCIRHSTNPQVQSAALLLIASLASWVPEVVLHNLMPIFTFIGSTLLRQTDDYSAHVVDQTISRVVPQLAESLRKRDKNLITGVADLLLSFTAAFEHVPLHRRLRLFSELARTLGPDDSLSAIIALLVDRYPNSTEPRKFVPGLLLQFDPVTTLKAFKGYLALVSDGCSEKRKISDVLFSLNEKQPTQVENALNQLLGALAELAANQTIHTHIAKAFRKNRDRSLPRAVFADIIESIIQLSKQVAGRPKLNESCRRVLTKCLDLLPTIDLISSAELLLSNPDPKVQVAAVRSVELRAGSVVQHDQQSVDSLLSFLPQADALLQKSEDIDVKAVTVSCIDRVIERFGKKDVTAVESVARTIAGAQSLASKEDRVRILSLLCITSIVDVLEEEAISLLPTVLPIAFKYLEESITEEKRGLHNAVFALLTNIVDRLAFMFSREYLIPALKLSHRSAVGDLGDSCDESRRGFYQSLSAGLEAQEIFVAIKSTWSAALSNGYESSREMLDLILATIENQTKSKMVKASSTLFNVLLETFDIRRAITAEATKATLEEDELELLETALIESIIAMTLKLNDSLFRPFFVQLVDAANSSSKQVKSHSITLCKFLAAFFDRFKSIVTSYSSYIIEHTVSLLNYIAQNPEESDLQTAVLKALQKSFQHDQDGFWQSPSHYSQILVPLLTQLTLPPQESATPVIPTITELATASASSVDNHREMNAILLKYMRSESASTRLATVKCEQSLTKRLGEEWLALLPEMLPFISELREDDDEEVERETQRWINMVEEILGEDLEAMLQ